MSYLPGPLIFIFIFSIFFIIILNRIPDNAEISDIFLKKQGISNVLINFDKNSFYIDVVLDKQLTCDQVSILLDIKELTIGQKIFKPSCGFLSKKVIRIKYSEVIIV